MTRVKASKPLKIRGVTIRPTWDWTSDYLFDVRAQARRLDAPMIGNGHERMIDRALIYALWLAHRDRVDLSEARDTRPVYGWVANGKPRPETRVHGIEFLDVNNYGRKEQYHAGGRWHTDSNYIKPTVVALIEFPNWDFTPNPRHGA